MRGVRGDGGWVGRGSVVSWIAKDSAAAPGTPTPLGESNSPPPPPSTPLCAPPLLFPALERVKQSITPVERPPGR